MTMTSRETRMTFLFTACMAVLVLGMWAFTYLRVGKLPGFGQALMFSDQLLILAFAWTNHRLCRRVERSIDQRHILETFE